MMFKKEFKKHHGGESNHGGASGTPASDSMIINFGRSPLRDIWDIFTCNVSDLVHANGVNFTSIFFIPKFIDGKTYLSSVLNSDNKNARPIWKIPGGTSVLGETLRQNIEREMSEETGFVPTEVTFIDSKKVASKEDKDVNHQDHTHFKILLSVNTKKGSMLTSKMRDPENTRHEFLAIEDILKMPDFNRGHKEFIKIWANFLCHYKMDKNFPDLYKYT